VNEQSNIYVRVGSRLAECRKSKGLSQNQLADIIEIQQRTYAHYELGTRKIQLDLLQKIANYFKIPVSYFIEDGLYSKVDFLRDHMHLVLQQIKNDGIEEMYEFIKDKDFDVQFKVLSGFLLDIEINEENRTIRLKYYI